MQIASKVSLSHEKLSFIIFFCATRGGCVVGAQRATRVFIREFPVELSGVQSSVRHTIKSGVARSYERLRQVSTSRLEVNAIIATPIGLRS